MFRTRNKLKIALMFLAMLAVFGWAGNVAAQLTDVEMDSNIVEEAAKTGEDWDSTAVGPASAGINCAGIPSLAQIRTGALVDPPGLSLFVQGAKDILDINEWFWADQNAPDKDEITNAYAAFYHPGSDNRIYFGADRFATNGNAFIGFWLLQDPNFAQLPGGTFSGLHVIGDVLLLSDFTGGGSTATPRVFVWNPGPAAFGGVKLTGNDFRLEEISVTGAVTGMVNTVRLKPKCWSYTGKFNPKDSIDIKGFFEAGLDFGLLGIPVPCATNFLAETRASASVDAQTKDFVFGTFLLAPEVSVNSDTVCAGDSAQLCATVVGGVPPFTYTWTGPLGFVDPGNVSCFYAKDSGSYKVVVASSNNCADSAFGSLTVIPNPPCSITGPSPVCPRTTNQYCGPTGTGLTYRWSISGNGSIPGSLTGQCVDVLAGNNCNARFVLTLTVKNAAQCSTTCIDSFLVQDITDPVFTSFPPDAIFDCVAGNSGRPTASDNCSGVRIDSVDVPSGRCPVVITRTWTATDTCGNSASRVQTITVRDITDPTFTFFPPNAVFDCVQGNGGRPTASDNCGPVTIDSVDSAPVGRCPYVITRTWTATDTCGNDVSRDQTITVRDITDPTFGDFPDDDVFDCVQGNGGRPTASDNCGPVTIDSVDSGPVGRCPYVITRTWTATDTCGNDVSRDQLITVQDTTDPVITCPPNDSVACGVTPVFGTATATDECGTATVTCGSVVITSGPGLGEFTHTRVCFATDTCGNVSAPCNSFIVVLACAEGCTPGFWKNHTEAWDQASDPTSACVAAAIAAKGAPYSGNGTTGSSFRTTFGLTGPQMTAAGLNSALTLLQAINLGGGGFQKLARHGTSAILNSCAVAYGFTSVAVLTMVHDSIIALDAESLATRLALANNASHINCPTGASVGEKMLMDAEEAGSSTGAAALDKAPGGQLPTEFALRGSYPNPFNASTQIRYALPSAGRVKLVVYNILGSPVGTLVDGDMPAGEHSALWNGTDGSGRGLSSGIYFYKISFDGQVKVGRMNLLK